MFETQPLSRAQTDLFQKKGWVAAPRFFNTDEIAQVAAWTEELLARPEKPGTHWVYYEDSRSAPGRRIVQRVENFCPFHRGFDGLVHDERLTTATDQLLGGPTVLFKEKINLKLPGGGGFEPHQDQQAGWSTYAPMFVTALVSIDSSSEANGCLLMAYGPRVAGMIGQEWQPLTADDMKGLAFKALPTGPGDVLFFDSYAPHLSAPNQSGEQRRILYLTYNRASDGDHRARYYADKHKNFPPDIERDAGKTYTFRV